MLDIYSTSPGKDKEHHLVLWRFSRLSSRDSFFGITDSFLSVIVYGRARLAMEGKSVMPVSNPVSVMGTSAYCSLAQGKEVADADVAFLVMVSSGTKQMALGSWTDHDTSCVSEKENSITITIVDFNFSLGLMLTHHYAFIQIVTYLTFTKSVRHCYNSFNADLTNSVIDRYNRTQFHANGQILDGHQ